MSVASSEKSASISGVPVLPPELNAHKKRLMDLNVTAYPSRVNEHLLPPRALAATDFSLIDPLQYRKNHPIKNNNVSQAAASKLKWEPGIDMMSTSQLASFFMQMGQKLSESCELQQHKTIDTKGYSTNRLAPPYDERSTYRVDYCQDDPVTFHNHKADEEQDYRSGWSETEKTEVSASSKVPYMTLPETLLSSKRTTEYRKTMMPDAEREDFRTLSHYTYLPDLGTSFAYSAYRVNDPRRKIDFNPEITSLRNPKNFLEKTSEESGYDANKAKETHDELEHLRAARREKLAKKKELHEQNKASKEARMCGLKDAGFRKPPNGRADYVFLPPKHGC